ncbi:MAG TPA: nitrous oxide reductase family maturation protein NosD, partial [Thermoanaerobaculia bacterium]
KIEERPAPEMALFRPAVLALVLLALTAPLHRWLRRLAILVIAGTPLVVLVDLQLWLHRFGNDLDPTAPLRTPPFTPWALGTSSIGQFTTTAWPGLGMLCLLAAAAVLAAGGVFERRRRERAAAVRGAELGRPAVSLPVVALLAAGLALPAAAAGGGDGRGLEERLAAAPPGSTVTVTGGTWRGPLTIRGPLTVVGVGRPVIDGGGHGTVVTLEGEGVTFRGFVVRNSGRQVTEEAAGIGLRGDSHTVEANRVEDVYFGIHVAHGGGHTIAGNDVEPGLARGARPGHAISLWSTHDTVVAGNRVRHARDGVYLSFVDRVLIEDNEVSDCRYGVHSMYSQDSEVRGNHLHHNLLGAALMYSRTLTLEGNTIEEQRAGATPYAILLKDIDDLTVEGNRLVRNRVGLYADGVAQTRGSEARIHGNLVAGHEAGLVLQSNARVTAAGNVLLDNLVDVRSGGGRLAAGNRWTEGGRGNFWSQYRGYDRDGDGLGDPPHRVEGAMEELLARDARVQAFLYTPAHLALEAAARMFPLFRPAPLLVDEAPLMRPPLPEVTR